MKTCPACGQEIKGEAPSYPVTCPQCGVSYGNGGEVANHRPGSEACRAYAARAGVAAGLAAAQDGSAEQERK